jgi:hypothetical protein
VEGNNNGKITLEELYNYAHEKTKVHVANTYALKQMPAMYGSVVGRFEIASVPSRSNLEKFMADAEPAPDLALLNKPLGPTASIQQPLAAPQSGSQPSPKPGEAPQSQPVEKPMTKEATHPNLTQGNIYFTQGDYDNAINSFTAVLEDGELSSATRKQARMGRGACFLAKGGRENCQKALTDQQAAGLKGIIMTIVKPTENLMVTTNAVGVVKQNEMVQITQINGEWLWVNSVNGIEAKRGYIKWDAVLRANGSTAAPQAQPVAAATPGQPATTYQPYEGEFYGQSRGVGHQHYSRPSGGNYQGETPALRTEYRALDTQENRLDRLENRNAPQGTIRAQERKVEMQERKIDRMESFRERRGR